ncbi:hypothetical protein F4780DRAFT_795560 [Xylariomycetidae sp. FL0641]|nr:hypothetical protein F4780DRAFT_795560 [Xylariomycetidae sp. FL0641]
MGNPYYDPSYNPYPPPVLIGTAVLFMILPVVAVALRFYARLVSEAKLGIDDWITIPSMILCIALSILQILSVTLGGLGSHQQLVDGEPAHTAQIVAYQKIRYCFEVIGSVGLCAIKLSVLLFFRRIFSTPSFRKVNNVFILVTITWGLAYTFVLAFQCTPPRFYWEKLENEYESCVNIFQLYVSFAYSDLFLDIFIFLLPIAPLWSLHMPIKQKFAVGGIFLLGSIAIAVGIARAILFSWAADFAIHEPETYLADLTWYNGGLLFWHMVENAIGLLGCCLPSYTAVVKSFRHTRKASRDVPGNRDFRLAYKRVPDEISLSNIHVGNKLSAGSEGRSADVAERGVASKSQQC